MLNHFRTLLLNLEDKSDKAEHIPVGFVPITLPTPLEAFHKLIFPPSASRFNRLFLAHNYLRYIEASNLTDDILTYDKRISYNLTSNKDLYFKYHRISNPRIVSANPSANDKKVQITLKGKYDSTTNLDRFYKIIRIEQLTNSLNVKIQSVEYNAEGNMIVLETYTNSTALVFNNVYGTSTGYSQFIDISKIGIKVMIYAPTTFTATSDKAWEVLVESPIVFDFNSTYNTVLNSTDIVTDMLKQIPSTDTSKYEQIWKGHFNKVYKLAALLIAYVARVDNLHNKLNE